MAPLRLAVLALAAAAVAVVAQEGMGDEGTAAAGGVSVKVYGQGGVFEAYRTMLGENDPNRVVVLMDSLQEVDADGSPVGTSGEPQHAINTFAAEDFTVGGPQGADAGLGYGISSQVSFSSPAGSIGQLSIDTLILAKAGAYGQQGDQWNPALGDLKWRIKLSSWSWCGCTRDDGQEQVGKFIDVFVSVQGSNSYPFKVVGGTYDIGGGVAMELSNKVVVDGVVTPMPLGYPRLVTKGSSRVFVLRFPKFSASAVYEPLLRMSGLATTTSTTTGVFAEIGAAGTSIDVQRRSGRFTAYSTEAGQSDPNKVVVRLDAMREVDARGRAVGTFGSKKHYLQTFAAQDFAVGTPRPVDIGTARASKVSSSSLVGSIGQISVDTFILTRAGIVGTKNHTWHAAVGDLKWNIALSNWTWCGCMDSHGKEEKGVYIDLDVSVRGIGEEPRQIEEHAYDLGGGVIMELTNLIEVDGVGTSMPVGYPRLEVRGSPPARVFVFRFPKFRRSVVYDPLLRMSSSESLVGSQPMFVNCAAGPMQGPAVLALKALALVAGALLSAGAV